MVGCIYLIIVLLHLHVRRFYFKRFMKFGVQTDLPFPYTKLKLPSGLEFFMMKNKIPDGWWQVFIFQKEESK